MKSIISHKTAFLYYRWFRGIRTYVLDQDLPICKKLKVADLYTASQRSAIIDAIKNICDINNVDVLCKNNNKLYKLDNLNIHKSNLVYSKNSFRKINSEVIIVSPELLFYQLANSLSFPDLLLAGFELCGSYALSNENVDFVSDIKQVSNPKKIETYLLQLKKDNSKCRNINVALRAVKYLQENSYSPMESRLYIMLCGPRNMGAYGITGMKLNCEVAISEQANKMIDQQVIVPDISNPARKLAIEYDSSAFHSKIEQNQKDKMRINALQHDNWQVFTFVKANIHNINSFHALAMDILKCNKQDCRIRRKDFFNRRNTLYDQLFWNFL